MFQEEWVTVIVPTTPDRFEFNESIIRQFMAQDYPKKNILLSYDSETVGEKRNRLCKAAIGSIIVHMDSDDYYAPDWISTSVDVLLSSGCDIVGLDNFNLIDLEANTCWSYDYLSLHKPWVAGATMCYWKRFWEQEPFRSINVGEDNWFVWKEKTNVLAHGYKDRFVASIHGKNTSKRVLCWPHYTECQTEEKMKIIHNIQNQFQ